MTLNLFSIEDKIAVIEAEIAEARQFRREPGSPMQRHYQILKAIAADLRARAEHPRSNALGALERELTRLRSSKTALGYDQGRIIELATLVVSKWPTISQALERYGEESAE
jgi:predicted esterase